MGSERAVEADLVKHFGPIKAVDGISFEVPSGVFDHPLAFAAFASPRAYLVNQEFMCRIE